MWKNSSQESSKVTLRIKRSYPALSTKILYKATFLLSVICISSTTDNIDINTCDTGIFSSSDLQSWIHHIRYQGVWGQQFRVRSGSDTIVCVVSLLTQYNTEWLMSPSHLSQVSTWYASIGIAFRNSINAPLVFENLISVNWLPSVPLVSAVACRRLMNNFKFVS